MTRTAALIHRHLPIGLQTFAKLRSEDCYYVDKTGMAIEVADEHLKFVFLTGVSKFSKVSLFSGLNHLKDLTLDARYSALCGYTDEDVNTVFAPELPGLDREEIRRWYNGYNWLEERASTTRMTCCCCSTAGSSRRIGSRLARRHFW